MDKKIIIISLLLSGCTVVDSGSVMPTHTKPTLQKKSPVPITDRQTPGDAGTLTNIRYVYIGMTRKEVETIMGKHLTIGHQKEDTVTNDFKPITLNAPYRKEVLKRRKKNLCRPLLFYTNHKSRWVGCRG